MAHQAKLGVCEMTFREPEFKADVEIAARAGMQAFSANRACVERFGVRAARQLLRDAGLESGSLVSIGGFLTPGGRGRDGTAEEEADKAIAMAHELGAPNILVTPFGRAANLSVAEADLLTVDFLARVAPLAKQAGVRLTLEPCHPVLQPFVHVNTLRDALDLVRQVPGVQVLADTSHLYWDRRFLADFRENIDLMGAVQVSNIDLAGLQSYRYDRPTLTTGAIDMAEMIRGMHAAGFQGAYEIELLRFTPSPTGKGMGPILGLPREEVRGVLAEARAWFDGLWE